MSLDIGAQGWALCCRAVFSAWCIGLLSLSSWGMVAHADDELRFDVQRYQVDGNSVLAGDRIESLLAPAGGKGKTLADLLSAVQLLQDAYRNAGYAAVQVVLPEQDTTAGIIRLGVIEPKIVGVEVEWDETPESEREAAIERVLPALRIGQTPNVRAIDDAVRLANENPARRIQVALESTGTGSDILARVKVESSPPVRIFARADNTGSVATGRTRASAGVQHANMFKLDHVLTVQYTTSPERPKQTQSFSVGYRIPFYANKLMLDLVAAYSDTEAATTGTPAGDLNFAGKGNIFSAHLTRQLPTQGLWEQRIAVGIDYKAFTNICSLGAFGAAGCGTAGASVTVHPLSVSYGGKWGDKGRQFQAGMSYSRNLPGGEKGTDADFVAARAGAVSAYDVFRANAEFSTAISEGTFKGWLGHAAFNMQESGNALVSAEQFGLGGANSVRGYAERVQGNDRGWRASFEAFTPGIGGLFHLPADSLRAVFFHDVGATFRNQVQVGEAASTRLASLGLGLRIAVRQKFQAQIDFGQALTNHETVKRGDWRAHVSIGLTW